MDKDDCKEVVKKSKLGSRIAVIFLSVFILGNAYFLSDYFRVEAKGTNNKLFGGLILSAKNFAQSAVFLLGKTFSPKDNASDYEVSLDNRPLGSAREFDGKQTDGEEISLCGFEVGGKPNHNAVILNEIAWMGTNANSNHEWIELKNISDNEVNISFWQLLDKDEQIKIIFPKNSKISKNGFYLLGRNGEAVPNAKIDILYAGNLKNSDEGLRLFDIDCGLLDEVLADPDWPAGINNKGNKRTMERNLSNFSWHTSATLGGTPQNENSKGIVQKTIENSEQETAPPVQLNSSSTQTGNGSNNINRNIEPSICPQVNLNLPTHEVSVNEIAWAGTASSKTSDEWIELKNNSGGSINLAGWQFLGKDANIKVFFENGDNLSLGSYFLLERTDDNAVPSVPADKFFTNAIKNSSESLRLFNQNCRLVDEVLASSDWLAGSASPDYRTAERANDFSWRTYKGGGSNGIFGTPKSENSEGQINDGDQNPPPPPPPPPSSSHTLTVSKSGTGQGTLTSNPSGIGCGSDCSENYQAGAQIVIAATPDSGSIFTGWSGACSGTGGCSITINAEKSVNAVFDLISPPPPPAPLKIEITEIMYDLPGADTGREWVEIFNSGNEPVDFTGWRFWEADINHNLAVAQGSVILSPGARAVIVIDSAKFLLDNAGYSGTIFDSSFSLSNTGETIGLKNGADVIDEVIYTSSTGGSGDGNSLQKVGGVWVATTPTPGQ